MTQTASGHRRLACNNGVKTSHAPPSPPSDVDHSVQKGSDMRVRCFFAVLDPEGTAKLKGTKHSACSNSFKNVNRLKEHLWRAHSPTHNCPHCRQKSTNKPTKEFKELHARCRPGSTKNSRPLPTLISKQQADSLGSLNQHFNKPNDETVRCEKLWKALFPGEDFDEKRFVCSDGADGADGKQSGPSNNHTSSKSRKPGQQPKTSATVAQNATPPTSPGASQGSKKAVNGSLFPVVNDPTEETGIPQSTPSLDSGIGMGPVEVNNNKGNKRRGSSRRESVDDITTNSPIRGIGAKFQETSEAAYVKRVLVGREMSEDSTPPSGNDFEVRRGSIPGMIEGPFAARKTSSAYTESISSRSDTGMSQSDGNTGREYDDDEDDDGMSTGRDSGIVSDSEMFEEDQRAAIPDPFDAAVQAINNRDFRIAAQGAIWDADDDVSMGSDSDC